MIAFDLQCCNGHKFEGWFADHKAYTYQHKQKMIQCPICDTIEIDKCLSPFAIKKCGPGRQSKETQAAISPEHALTKLVEYVENNFDDVGSEFATEALKMHYGVAEPRNIRGVSSEEEEKTLKNEGIQFFKLPMPSSSDSDA